MTRSCRHYWLLAQPDGAMVAGQCKRCGRERAFPAHLEETERSNDYQDLQREPSAPRAEPWRAGVAA